MLALDQLAATLREKEHRKIGQNNRTANVANAIQGMPKRTYKDLEKLHGVTRDQLNSLKSKGVNIWNDDECEAALSSVRNRIKPDATLPEDSPAAEADTIDSIREQLAKSKDYETVKILSEKLKGLQVALRVQRESRELVPVGEVRQSMTRVTSAARAEILKLAADMPPRLEGLDAASMQKILRDAIHEVLTRLSDETSRLYADA